MSTIASSSTGLRLLAGLAGGAALLGVLVFSAGLLLPALLGMAVTAAVMRRRDRPLTRVAGWLGAASGVAITIALLMMVIVTVTSDDLVGEMQRLAAEEDTREPTAIERALERLAARDPASIAVERQMESVTTSGPFIWVTVILTIAMVSAFLGAVVGSVSWICAVLLLYGITGRWPPGGRELRDDSVTSSTV